MSKRKAWRSILVAASVAAVAFASTPGSARDCEPELNYRYCGDHVPASRLPLKFANTGGGPVGDISGAISGAMQQWNLVFPGNKIGCNPLCLSGSGTSTISWGNPASCPGTPSTALAVTCITYDPPGSSKIKRADIILNNVSGYTWKVAGLGDLAAGEVDGALWGNAPLGKDWYDVQSVLTHELGHALGLEHIGGGAPFPSDLSDSWKYQETMYRWSFPGSTAARTLGAGDIAGIQRVALDTYSD